MNEKTFTPLPNEYLDALCRCENRIPGEAVLILNVIHRLTFGWLDEKTGERRTKAVISTKTFRKMTGYQDNQIIRGRDTLLKMNIIATHRSVSRGPVTYSIQTDYTKWHPLTKARVSKKSHSLLTKARVSNSQKRELNHSQKRESLLILKKEEKKVFKESKTSNTRSQLKTQKENPALSLRLLKSRKIDLEEDRTKWLKNNPGDSNDPYTKDISSLAENIKSSEKNAHNPKLQHKAAKTKEKKRT